MSAGYIQLAAIGQQDIYLTGNPEVTYFSGVYKRHTPFVLEAFDIPFKDQQVLFGKTNICRIPPKGDIIRGMTAKISLPALTNPGNNWSWPTPATSSYVPHIIINGTYFTLKALANVSFYSTTNFASWISSNTLTSPPITTYISYNSAANQFNFANTASIEVDSTFGVFWGFDPTQGSPHNSNLVYSGTSNVVTPNFTLQQSGWYNIANFVNQKSGIFLTPVSYTISSTSTYLNFNGIDNAGNFLWTNQVTLPSPQPYSITAPIGNSPGGRIQFGGTGTYIMRIMLNLSVGSLASVSYGSTTTESSDDINSLNFTTTVSFPVSPDPSSPLMLPIVVVNTSNTYYFFATSTTSASLLTSSYFSINPSDELYQLNNPVNFSVQNSIVPFYGNVSPLNSLVNLQTNSSFKFASTGTFLISGIIYTTEPTYVSNVSVAAQSVLFVYDMTLQGRNPTFTFSIPLTVTDTTQTYTISVASNATTWTMGSSSFFTINQTGLLPGGKPGVVLPFNGTLLTPTNLSQTLNGPLNLSTDFSAVTASYDITTSGTTMTFSNTGAYMMTAVISSQYEISSISFGTSTYNVGLGLLPPYTVSIPLLVPTTPVSAQISVISLSSSPQTISSNTYISVYPIASNSSVNYNYNYNDSVGTWVINTAELKIGGQSIQTLTGEYIELWNDLHIPYENQPGLTLLTGKYDTSNVLPPGRTYFTNLPFYFYGSEELGLPIAALGRQDVEVWLTFRNFSELTSVSVTDPTITATILTEYAYLSDPEIDWLTSHKLEYVITQQQYQYFDLLPNFTSSIFELNFINPVREMFFVLQPTTNPNYDYSGNGLLSLAMSFNGAEAFTADTTDALYVGSLVPFNRYINYPTRNFYMYTFTTQTETARPYGQVNMSRIRQILLELTSDPSFSAKQLRICAVNYNVMRIQNGIAGLMFNSGTVSVPAN